MHILYVRVVFESLYIYAYVYTHANTCPRSNHKHPSPAKSTISYFDCPNQNFNYPCSYSWSDMLNNMIAGTVQTIRVNHSGRPEAEVDKATSLIFKTLSLSRCNGITPRQESQRVPKQTLYQKLFVAPHCLHPISVPLQCLSQNTHRAST